MSYLRQQVNSSIEFWYRKKGWLGPIFGIFHYLLPHCKWLNHLTLSALTLLIKKTRDFRSPSFLVFLSLQTGEVAISEMGWLGPMPILDSKLIPLVPLFTNAIAGHMSYWSIKNGVKWFPSNLSIQFAQWSIHITVKITRG